MNQKKKTFIRCYAESGNEDSPRLYLEYTSILKQCKGIVIEVLCIFFSLFNYNQVKGFHTIIIF